MCLGNPDVVVYQTTNIPHNYQSKDLGHKQEIF